MTRSIVTVIAAVASNAVIGCKGGMPWSLKDDLKAFKERTMDGVLVMGRKTYESIGRPLPGRETIVVSKTMPKTPGVFQEDTLRQAVDAGISTGKPVFIVGGEVIFRDGLRMADKAIITHIAGTPDGDVFFPMEVLEKLFVPTRLIARVAAGNGNSHNFLVKEWTNKKKLT